ncbi:MAG: hypothetical protein KatS3mg069_2284 [Meiothermus sp.]|jgi:hypothetical protein|nr:MAG: hypothetical protein KatS3mg069_2284 [Meiothermus sp.]
MQNGVRLVSPRFVVFIALFTDVATRMGGHCSVRGKAFSKSRGPKIVKSALDRAGSGDSPRILPSDCVCKP